MILESFSRDYQQITFAMVNRFCLLNKHKLPPPTRSSVLLFFTDKAGWNTKRSMAFLNCIPANFCISYCFYISFYISRYYFLKFLELLQHYLKKDIFIKNFPLLLDLLKLPYSLSLLTAKI